MRYYSTRDQNCDDSGAVDFERVLFSAYTSDGGLYVPRELPQLDWRQWQDFSYKRVVAEILKAFVDDGRVDIDGIVDSAYSGENFDHPDIVPVSKPSDDDMYIVELFHGPTWSFKDYALQVIGRLLQAYLELNRRHLILLIVTTGDTGSAAIEAVRNCPNIDIIVMYSQGLVTPIQERQMTSVIADNVHVLPADGPCGDLDTAVRHIFADVDFVRKYNVGSINSINWARIMIQMAHWFYAYFRVMTPLNKVGQPLTVAIPTGAAGNLSAALYARKLGLPLNIVACNNKNDIIHKWIQTGKLQHEAVESSLASAMDIDMPYNIERIIHLLEYKDTSTADRVGRIAQAMMEKFYAGVEAEMEAEVAKNLKSAVTSVMVPDMEIETTIKKLHTQTRYACCPHTATAVHFAYENPNIRPIATASTASPYKFMEIVTEFGIELAPDERLEKLRKAPTRTDGILRSGEDWLKLIKQKIIDLHK